MALTLTSTDVTLTGIDFIKFLTGSPVIKQSLNEPTTIDLDMAAWGAGFVLPRRGSYFTLATDSDPKYWTGFVVNAPQLEYIGKHPVTDQPTWSWKFQGTDDSYILNLAPLGILPVYINQTQGAIIKDLANRIAPGKFNTTGVLDGQLVQYFFVNPTSTFGEIVKDFAESAYYRFWANDFKLFYERQDATPATLTINGYSDQNSRVRIASSTGATPIVVTTTIPHGLSNLDCISISDHVLGSGLKSAAVGNWFIESVGASNFTLTDSVGNGTGTTSGWAGKHNPHFTPARLSIGPVNDPVINDAIVLGDIEPQGLINEFFVGDGLTNAFPMLSSIYGVDSALLLDDVFSGTAVDTNIWTEVDSVNNVIQVANGYLNIIGNAADAYTVYLQSKALVPLQGNLRMTHGEYDFVGATNNGVIASLWTATPGPPTGAGLFTGCVYGIRAVASGSTVILRPIVNGVVQDGTGGSEDLSYTALLQAANKRYIIRTLVNFQNIIRHDREYLFRSILGTLGSYGGNTLPDVPVYRTIITEIDALTGKPTTNQTVWTSAGSVTGLDPGQFYAAYVPAVSNNLHMTVSNITISVPMQVALYTLDKDVWYPQFNTYDLITGEPGVQDLTTLTWTPKAIGPNEIDSYDNMGSVATVVTTRQGRIDQGNILGSTLYNSGDATLTFFKDSVKLTANTPIPGQLMRLRYRRAGIALGRAQDAALIVSEAAVWGDNGLRTITKKDLNPLPRTSLECEMAAAALVAGGSYQHYAGTYDQFSTVEFTGVPRPGTVLRFANLPAGLPVFQSEVITSVESLIDSRAKDIVKHTVTFGKPDQVKKFLSGLKEPPNPFAPSDTAQLPTAADLASIIETTNALSLLFNSITLTLTYGGLSEFFPPTALDILLDLHLKSWTSDPLNPDSNYFVINIGATPPAGGGFEIRYSDQGWGDPNNKNFLYYDTITTGQTTASTFKIARSRNTVCFVRAFDSTGKYSRYSSGIRVVFPGIPDRVQGFKSVGGTLTHPRFKAFLPTVDDTEEGIPILSNDIFGLEAYFVHEQAVSGWFERNGAVQGTPYVASTGSNPGAWEITTTNPTGLTYLVNTVSLPVTGTDLATQHGYINMLPIDMDAATIVLERNKEVVFFVWAKSDTNNTIIRLNIKDDLAVSPVPFGFYSRHDYTLVSNATWYPIFTRVKLPDTIAGTPHFNIVIHNIGASSATLSFALPLLGVGIASNEDIVLGASPDNPYLEFEYNNEGTVIP